MPVVSPFILYVNTSAYDLRKVSSIVDGDDPAMVYARFIDEPRVAIPFDRITFEAAWQTALAAAVVPPSNFHFFVSSAAAVAGAPFANWSFVVIDPGSPTSEAGTYQVIANGGIAFPADYTKVSDKTDTASEVAVVDVGNFFTGTNVETVLQEVGSGTTLPQSAVLTVGPTNVLDSMPIAAYGSADWAVELVKGTSRYKSNIHAVHDGALGYFFEDGIVVGLGIGVLPITFNVDVNAGSFRLTAVSVDAGWTFRVRRMTAFAP